MSQLRQRQSRLDELDIRPKVVAFDRDFMAIAYAKETDLQWPILLDTSRSLYQAYGMTKGSWWGMYNPISIAKYIWLILRGRMPGKPGEDWKQLGGDILIDPQGVVRLHHVSANPHDRPTVDEICDVVENSDLA